MNEFIAVLFIEGIECLVIQFYKYRKQLNVEELLKYALLFIFLTISSFHRMTLLAANVFRHVWNRFSKHHQASFCRFQDECLPVPSLFLAANLKTSTIARAIHL